MLNLSVALAVYNEEENLAQCLTPLVGWAKEIVVVDGGSQDKTVEIARQLGAKIIQTDNPPIFHLNKQKALDACQESWILQLDADEVVSVSLKQEVEKIIINPKAKDAYYLPRRNYFLGHWLRKGGQYPDYVIRLFKKGKGKFPCQSVHEQIAISGTVGHLQNPLDHYSYKTVAEYWKKANLYINLTVNQFSQKKIKKNILTGIEYLLFKPIATFFLIFVRHKGFVDGYYGFLFSLFSAWHYSVAYWRYLKS